MHFEDGQIPFEYQRYIGRKVTFLVITFAMLILAFVASIALGAVHISVVDVLKSMVGEAVSERIDAIIWHIRLPQALTAIMAGAGLSVAGTAMQSVLRNPLGSPFTLGISHAAAFGAALSVMLKDTSILSFGNESIAASPFFMTLSAFVFSVAAALTLLVVSRVRGTSAESMILTGVALGALFTAGTMFLQFFADDVQLGAIVFWTFGDTARASWPKLQIISAATIGASIYFYASSWKFNAMEAGEETARGLGLRVGRIRNVNMLVASLLTAVIIAFIGIVGFVGLVVPHIFRRLVGVDHRFLIPATIVGGALLLLISDTVARFILSPHTLPVSVLTAFMGAPMLIYLIVRGQRR